VFSCSWDEWLDLDRLMKHTEENMRKKHDLDEKLGNDKNAKIPRGSLAKSKTTNGQIFLFCTFSYFNPNDLSYFLSRNIDSRRGCYCVKANSISSIALELDFLCLVLNWRM